MPMIYIYNIYIYMMYVCIRISIYTHMIFVYHDAEKRSIERLMHVTKDQEAEKIHTHTHIHPHTYILSGCWKEVQQTIDACDQGTSWRAEETNDGGMHLCMCVCMCEKIVLVLVPVRIVLFIVRQKTQISYTRMCSYSKHSYTYD